MQIRKRENLIAMLLFVVGILARTYMFGSVPAGLNQDEAFAAYDAWSILNYGVDSAGKSYPVYLTAWGSGMNALETYLMIPFVALFGMKVWAIRLPQLIVAILSLIAIYDMTKRSLGKSCALWVLGICAICPWHIMLSRWALESNLAPGFLLFGAYFFVRALENRKFLIISALMYGLSLYCYATIWPIVPLILLLQLLYCRKELRIDRYAVISALILLVLALPLMLFLAVNYGWIEELRIGAITIPKLVVMRASEFSIASMDENIANTVKILWNQSDRIFWNSSNAFGILYMLSTPLYILGIIVAAIKAYKKSEQSRMEGIMLIWLAGALFLGALIEVNINRINIIFFPLIFFTGYGANLAVSYFGKAGKIGITAAYALMFCLFLSFYFGEFEMLSHYYYQDGLGSALKAAEEKSETLYMDKSIFHSQVLFYSQTDPYTFMETVEYRKYPAKYLSAKSFGKYVFDIDTSQIDEKASYIVLYSEDAKSLQNAGFTLEKHGVYNLAYKEW